MLVLRRVLVYGMMLPGLLAHPWGQAIAQEVSAPKQNVLGGTTLQASLEQTGTWSSNPLMSIAGNSEVWGSTTSPELIFKNATPLSQINAGIRIDENVFNKSDFSSTDVHEKAALSKRNQRWTVGLRQSVDYDTTNSSEPSNYGLPAVVTRHLGLSLAPQIAFSPSDEDTLALTGTAVQSMYDDSTFSDYRTLSADASYSHRFDPLNTGVISMQARQYKTTRNNAVTVESWSPTVGWQRSISSRLSANASFGAQASREYNYGVAATSWTWQHVFSGGLSYTGKQDTLDVAASRAQVPYGNGADALQTSFSISESHNLTPLVTLNFGVDYQTADYQTVSTGNLETLVGGRVGIAYHLTETLDLTANYRYRHETLTNETKTAQDNAFTVGLVYRPSVWTLAP